MIETQSMGAQHRDRGRRRQVIQNALVLAVLAALVYGGFILLVHWRGGS